MELLDRNYRIRGCRLRDGPGHHWLGGAGGGIPHRLYEASKADLWVKLVTGAFMTAAVYGVVGDEFALAAGPLSAFTPQVCRQLRA